MSKLLIIGDIHGRDTWKDILNQEQDFDKVIFLGDYIDSYTINTNTQYNNLLDILQYKEDNFDKVILLRGNHDLSSGLNYNWAECSGYNRQMAKIFPKERFLNDTQWIYIEDNYIFSHAGITDIWMKNIGINSVEEINNLKPSENFAFCPDNIFDVYGTSKTQGPVWIRPETLAQYCVEGYNQIVGHTMVNHHIVNIKQAVKCKQDIWLCDALHVNEYLILDNGNAKICKLEGK